MSRKARPTSEIFYSHPLRYEVSEIDKFNHASDQWLADLELHQKTLEEIASANFDQDFKNELNYVQEWFNVLSVGERTAALYTLLQGCSQVC